MNSVGHGLVCGKEPDFVPYSTRIRDFFQRWPGAVCEVGYLKLLVSWHSLARVCQDGAVAEKSDEPEIDPSQAFFWHQLLTKASENKFLDLLVGPGLAFLSSCTFDVITFSAVQCSAGHRLSRLQVACTLFAQMHVRGV